MTRRIIVASATLGIAVLAGCAAHRPADTPPVAELRSEAVEAEPAAALIFQSPVATASRTMDLSRAAREPAAFVGFDGPMTTFIYEEINDRQSDYGGDRYDRRTRTYRIGSSTR